jgi:hypothetical protein
MTLAAIDWFRAGADILGAFACTMVGQWWGYRQGRKQGRREGLLFAEIEAKARKAAEGFEFVTVPDRQDEHLP